MGNPQKTHNKIPISHPSYQLQCSSIKSSLLVKSAQDNRICFLDVNFFLSFFSSNFSYFHLLFQIDIFLSLINRLLFSSLNFFILFSFLIFVFRSYQNKIFFFFVFLSQFSYFLSLMNLYLLSLIFF